MFKTAYQTILCSFLVFGFISPNASANWKNIICPGASVELGLEAFLFATNGVKQGYDSKCTKNFKYFDLDEIDVSDSGGISKISPKDIQVKILKTSPSGVVFYEITYKDFFNKRQTALINVLSRSNAEGGEVEDSACGSLLLVKPDNLVRRECI